MMNPHYCEVRASDFESVQRDISDLKTAIDILRYDMDAAVRDLRSLIDSVKSAVQDHRAFGSHQQQQDYET